MKQVDIKPYLHMGNTDTIATPRFLKLLLNKCFDPVPQPNYVRCRKTYMCMCSIAAEPTQRRLYPFCEPTYLTWEAIPEGQSNFKKAVKLITVTKKVPLEDGMMYSPGFTSLQFFLLWLPIPGDCNLTFLLQGFVTASTSSFLGFLLRGTRL